MSSRQSRDFDSIQIILNHVSPGNGLSKPFTYVAQYNLFDIAPKIGSPKPQLRTKFTICILAFGELFDDATCPCPRPDLLNEFQTYKISAP
jgi:hypothetical protein